MPGECLEGVRNVSGKCFEAVWKKCACFKEGSREYKYSLLNARSSHDTYIQDSSREDSSSPDSSSQDRSSQVR